MKKIIAVRTNNCNYDSDDDDFFKEFSKLTVGSKHRTRVISQERPSAPCNLEPEKPKISVPKYFKNPPFGTFSGFSTINSTTAPAYSPASIATSLSAPDLAKCLEGKLDESDAKDQPNKRSRQG